MKAICLWLIAGLVYGQTLPTADQLFQRAVNHLAAKQLDEAEMLFRQLRAMEKDAVRGAVGVAQTLMAKGRSAEAVDYLTGEVAKDPANPKLNVALGDIAAQAGQGSVALARYSRALEILKTDPAAMQFFVKRSPRRLEAQKDPYVAALENFTGVDNTPPGPGGILLRVGEIFLRGGDLVRGAEAFENARKLVPPDEGLLLNLSMVYEAQKSVVKAAATYRDLLKLAPNNAAALNNLAFLQAENGGDLDEALQMALKARELQPQSDEVADTVGWVYFRRKALAQAIEIFAPLVQKAPENLNYRNRFRACLEQMPTKTQEMTQLLTMLAAERSDEGNKQLSAMVARLFPR